MKVAVSYISSNYSTEETIKLIDESNADYIHVDLMDGKYVEVNNFEINDTLKLFSNTKKLLDIHLMVEEPEQYLLKLSKLNVDCITFHPKTTKYPEDLINIIKSLGLKAGIAINPDEEIDEFIDLFDKIDKIIVMSVKPGYGAQKFLDDVIPKINSLIDIKNDYNFLIEIDGGINEESIKKLPNIDLVVSGSYVCKSNDFNKSIETLKKM